MKNYREIVGRNYVISTNPTLTRVSAHMLSMTTSVAWSRHARFTHDGTEFEIIVPMDDSRIDRLDEVIGVDECPELSLAEAMELQLLFDCIPVTGGK